MLSAKRYLIILWGLFILILATPIIMTLAIDPKNYLILAGLKPAHPDSAQLQQAFLGSWPIPHGSVASKLLNLMVYKPDLVVIGSSTVWSYIDVHHPALQKESHQAYNFGLAGINMEDMEKLFHHLVTLDSPKTIIIGLEYSMFLRERFSPESFDTIPLAQDPHFKQRAFYFFIKNIFNDGYMLESIYFIKNKFLEEPFMKVRNVVNTFLNKNQPTSAGTASIANVNFCDFKKTLINGEQMMNRILYPQKKKWTAAHGDLRLQISLEKLRKIVSLAKAHSIEMYFYISPNHARSLEYIRAMGFWPQYQSWLRSLPEITAGYPLWDFSGYNSITTEAIPDCRNTTEMLYYADSFHFKTIAGNLLLAKMFDEKSSSQPIPSDFGIRVTTHNVENHIAALEAGHLLYEKQHLQEVKEITQELEKLHYN